MKSAASLAQDLVHGDGSGRGGVEGIQLSSHREAEHEIAALAHKSTHPVPLRADHQRDGTREIRRPQPGFSVRRRAVYAFGLRKVGRQMRFGFYAARKSV